MLFAAVAVVCFCRLLFLQIVVADEYSSQAEESRTASFTTAPHRGTIYDRNGTVLAASVDATTVYCNPAEVTDADEEAAQIAGVLGGKASEYAGVLSRDATTFAYVKRQADVDEAARLEDLDLDGIYFVEDSRREYPNGSIGGQVVGCCDVDGNGINGLELQYDDILRGTPGTYSAERGVDGTPIPGGVHEDVAAVDGQDIVVSLDINLQASVEEELASGTTALKTQSGTSVVMDSSTGEIYAICSLPYMDPSDMDDSSVGSDNLAPITQILEPGSAFKTVSALALLESGSMTPDSTEYCPVSITADGYVITDSHTREAQTMTLRQIVAESSNVGISLSIADNMGFEKLYDAIMRYHLNDLTGVDFPGEESGRVPDYDDWSLIAAYNISFGQGVSFTPLQLTRFYAAIENDGVQETPHFLIALPGEDATPEYDSEEIVSDQEALADIRSMLRSVVEDGTGTEADIEGYDVVGKTSTAQVADYGTGTYKEGVYNLCFVGFIDNSSSDLVCFVSANEVHGQEKVTSIFHDIMSSAIDLYNIVPE